MKMERYHMWWFGFGPLWHGKYHALDFLVWFLRCLRCSLLWYILWSCPSFPSLLLFSFMTKSTRWRLWGVSLLCVSTISRDDKKAKADTNTSDDDDFVVGDFRLQGLKKSRNYGPTVCEVNYSNLFCNWAETRASTNSCWMLL